MLDFSQYSLPVENKDDYRAIFFNLNETDSRAAFQELLHIKKPVAIDRIEQQLTEFIKIKNPAVALTDDFIKEEIKKKLGDQKIENYGIWVFYPWSNKIVHLLPEDEFIVVRTSRNIYKISPDEIAKLRGKKIGVIGLSVGGAIATTLAMESVCGELRLADFDTLDLSNMNRLSSAVADLGVSKVVITARKIAELDPFIKVDCYLEGIKPENIDAFLEGKGKLDVLVEECDGIDIKILCRIKAREKGIAVVMDTNDRGMLDIERFDLEPSRPLFHGRLDESISVDVLNNLTTQEKLPLLDAMVNFDGLSKKMKFSLSQLGKTINTWPQLASSVMLGAAMVTDTCRRILLDEIHQSGRYNIDFDELIK